MEMILIIMMVIVLMIYCCFYFCFVLYVFGYVFVVYIDVYGVVDVSFIFFDIVLIYDGDKVFGIGLMVWFVWFVVV